MAEPRVIDEFADALTRERRRECVPSLPERVEGWSPVAVRRIYQAEPPRSVEACAMDRFVAASNYVLEATAYRDPQWLRRELIQTAAIALRWAECL